MSTIPRSKSLSTLRQAAAVCRNCPLYRSATQTVFGEGPRGARVVLVGEQPGDKEDLSGQPFSGPAGQLLDRALERAGIDREKVYVTNAVKHFKWYARGKRRMHDKPNAGEIKACHPWLDAELAAIAPEVVVCLGATAARSVLGRPVTISSVRGQALPGSPARLVTVHPSSILRTHTESERAKAFDAFVADLKRVGTMFASQ